MASRRQGALEKDVTKGLKAMHAFVRRLVYLARDAPLYFSSLLSQPFAKALQSPAIAGLPVALASRSHSSQIRCLLLRSIEPFV